MSQQRPLSVTESMRQHLKNNETSSFVRPNSDIVGAGIKSNEAEAIDKWFEDLNYYESALETMAKARLDDNFRDELSAIEQWFVVLSDAERTAALYSLLQHVNPVQIRFFSTVLHQKAQKDMPLYASARSSALGPIGRPPPGLNSNGTDGMLPSAPASAILNSSMSRSSFHGTTSTGVDELDSKRSSSFLDANNYDSFGISRLSQNPAQAGLLRPRTPVEEAIAAADWTSSEAKKRSSGGSTHHGPWTAPTTGNGVAAPASSHSNDFNDEMARMNLREVPPPEAPPSHHHSTISRSNSPMYRSHSPASHSRSMSPDPNRIASPAPKRPMSPYQHQVIWNTNNNQKGMKPNRPPSVSPSDYSDYSDSDDGYGCSGRHNRYRKSSNHGSPVPGHSRGSSHKEKGKIPDEIDLNVVQDVPVWLKSLRLHKYTSIFENKNYKEMIKMTDEELESIGVAALGARRKMLKVFEMVKKHLEDNGITY